MEELYSFVQEGAKYCPVDVHKFTLKYKVERICACSGSEGIPGLVDEAGFSQEEAVFVVRVLVLKDRSVLPEGTDSNSLCPRCEGSDTNSPARLRVLEACRRASQLCKRADYMLDGVLFCSLWSLSQKMQF